MISLDHYGAASKATLFGATLILIKRPYKVLLSWKIVGIEQIRRLKMGKDDYTERQLTSDWSNFKWKFYFVLK